jgi:hypothetical protein
MRNHAVQSAAEDRNTAQMPGGDSVEGTGIPPPDSQLDPPWKNAAQPSAGSSGVGGTIFRPETDGAASGDLNAAPTLATLSVEPPHSRRRKQTQRLWQRPKA